jgi:hypothetical protein
MPAGLDVLEMHAQLGPVWPLKAICIVSDRPTAVHMSSGLLHRDGGPAWEYSDGLRGWALNGVRVPQALAELPGEKIDPKLVVEETNAEVRREIVRKIGVERVCMKLGSKLIDKKDEYELITLDLGDGRKRPYLKMRNPSIATWHLEGVPPDISTVQEAINWRAYGDKTKSWDPAILT